MPDTHCPSVFANTQLHLALWDRLDPATHEAGLRLCDEFLKDASLKRYVMLLLYPAPRPTPDYYARSFADPDAAFPCVWCELWVQAGTAADVIVQQRLTDWRGKDPRRRRFLRYIGRGGPLWAPLSAGLVDCQYANCRTGGAQRFLCDVPPDQVAWLLKVIWHRAAPAVVATCVGSGSLRLLDPLVAADRAHLQGLARQVLSDFRVSDYGVKGPPGTVDPTAYFASHLACRAINAAIVTRQVYGLEDYYSVGGAITRPSEFPDRDRYLDALLHL